MCDAMNRDIVSVILGGYGTKATGSGEAIQFEGETTMTNIDETVQQLSEAQKNAQSARSALEVNTVRT